MPHPENDAQTQQHDEQTSLNELEAVLLESAQLSLAIRAKLLEEPDYGQTDESDYSAS